MKFLYVSCLIFLTISIATIDARKNKNERNYGDWIDITEKAPGQPFPKPQTYVTRDTQHKIDQKNFSFQYVKGSVTCDLLSVAFNRYYKLIFQPQTYEINENVRRVRKLTKRQLRNIEIEPNEVAVDRVIVNVEQPCEEYPSLESDESYTLEVAGNFASIESKSLWGALRALETFSQLVVEDNYGSFFVNDTYIMDYPRFNHRGLLLDTSRHYIHPSILKINIEAMAATKMNVFHWHIVDDQSFPYESYTYPNLSRLGAFDPYYHVYTTEDVKDIIEFARLRGVRVIPEFDTPGHTVSWGNAVPILTKCYKDSKPTGELGPIDPSNNLTYSFLRNFIKELATVFPDKYLHLGGDEVPFDCWESNPDITNFMKKMGFGNDYSKLEQFYEQNLLNIVKEVSPTTGYIIWQEVIDNNVKVRPDTVVEVWKDPWPQEMSMVTKYGYRTLLSTCWYLNYINYGSDWVKYYQCEPLNFEGTEQQKSLVIGGEACMWGEYVDGTNVISRTWPRVGAVAERLWSARDVTDVKDASKRLEQHRCRLISRGINAEPFDGPGFCNYELTA